MNQRNATTIGLDVGDRHCQVCMIDPVSGEVMEQSRIRTAPSTIERYFAVREPSVVALKVGTHSPWISRALKAAGHEAIVTNARQVRLIHASNRKNDRLDAKKLARLMRLDARLLSPIEHRTAKAQADLARIRSGDALVRTRSSLIAHVRGSVKAFGKRLPTGSTEAFPARARKHLPIDLRAALEPIIATIGIRS
ncbi:MAG: transposase [Dehalococcoidia bacterium]